MLRPGDADTEGPPDAIAARNVVDGLALRKAWKEGDLDLNSSDFFRDGDPPSDNQRAAVESELQRLDEAIDAVADLLTAESVYQMTSGNTGGANASLDAMAKGVRPPDPAIAQQPLAGIPLTHRVAIVLGGEARAVDGWTGEPTPRALAEPYVDGWVGRLLGDPRLVRCRVRLTLPPDDPDAASPAEVTEQPVTLSELQLRPIDVLDLARAASEGPAPFSELDQRVAEVVLAEAPPGAQVEEILYARDASWSPGEIRTFPDVLEVARAIHQLLARTRPLTQADLVTPDAAPLLPETIPLLETHERASGARDGLTEIAAELPDPIASANVARLQELLRSASLFGIAGAFPRTDAPGPLVDQATSVLGEIKRRVADAAAASDVVAIAQAIFGRAFPFLPCFTPPQEDELGLALETGAALVGDPGAPKRWIYQAARVRPTLAAWRKLALLTGALGTHTGTLDVVQLPHREGARWVALPFEDGAEPPSGLLSLVLHRLANPAPAQAWVGLLLDEWAEVIPPKAPTTGISFHFDTPGTEPPQAVLVAVPPTNAEAWDLDSLTAILRESIDLAKLRAVDGELLGVLGQLTPAVYLAANAANDTVSSNFIGALAVDSTIAEKET